MRREGMGRGGVPVPGEEKTLMGDNIMRATRQLRGSEISDNAHKDIMEYKVSWIKML